MGQVGAPVHSLHGASWRAGQDQEASRRRWPLSRPWKRGEAAMGGLPGRWMGVREASELGRGWRRWSSGAKPTAAFTIPSAGLCPQQLGGGRGECGGGGGGAGRGISHALRVMWPCVRLRLLSLTGGLAELGAKECAPHVPPPPPPPASKMLTLLPGGFCVTSSVLSISLFILITDRVLLDVVPRPAPHLPPHPTLRPGGLVGAGTLSLPGA